MIFTRKHLHRQNHTEVWRFVNTSKPSAFHAHQLQFVAQQCVYKVISLEHLMKNFSRETTKINNESREKKEKKRFTTTKSVNI